LRLQPGNRARVEHGNERRGPVVRNVAGDPWARNKGGRGTHRGDDKAGGRQALRGKPTASPKDPEARMNRYRGTHEVSEGRGFRVWRQVWKTGVSVFVKSDRPEK